MKLSLCGLVLGAMLALAGCQQSARVDRNPASLVVFGDSITRGYGAPPGLGWVELLSGHLQHPDRKRKIPVFNAGGNGNTSAEGRRRLAADVLVHLPGLVLVQFGGNDPVAGARNVTVDDFERNLTAIHREVIRSGGTMVLLTFPPVVDHWHSSRANTYFLERGGLDHMLEAYRQRTRELARQLNLPLFDLDHLLRRLSETKGFETYVDRDGIHLTPEGNRVVAEALLGFLEQESLIFL